MRDGAVVAPATLAAARERAASERAALPATQRRLDAERYPVEIAPGLAALRDRLAAEVGAEMPGRA